LTSYLLAGKALDSSGLLTSPYGVPIMNPLASLVGDELSISITRPLNSGLNPIKFDNQGYAYAMFISSYSFDTTGTIPKHIARQSFGLYVNLVTGQWGKSARYIIPMRVAHGVLMGVAYTIIFPMGLMVARYAKTTSQWWYRTHFFLQNYGFIVMITGIIIGYKLPAVQFKSYTYHGALGTAILILTVFQVLMGYLRPHKSKEGDPSMFRRAFELLHHNNGRIICMAAVAQIVGGFLELQAEQWAYGVWLPFTFLMCLACFILEIKLWVMDRGDKPFYELIL